MAGVRTGAEGDEVPVTAVLRNVGPRATDVVAG